MEEWLEVLEGGEPTSRKSLADLRAYNLDQGGNVDDSRRRHLDNLRVVSLDRR